MRTLRAGVVLTLSVLLAGAAAAGCSSSSPPVVRSSTATGSSSASGPVSTPVSSPASSTASSSAPAGKQTLTVTPSRDLRDGQQVLVQARGFSAGEPVQVIECAQKGTATGPGDCDLASMVSATTDAQGGLQSKLTVHRGPFGANSIVCGPTQPCLVSVTQATLSPTEEADAPISFATS